MSLCFGNASWKSSADVEQECSLLHVEAVTGREKEAYIPYLLLNQVVEAVVFCAVMCLSGSSCWGIPVSVWICVCSLLRNAMAVGPDEASMEQWEPSGNRHRNSSRVSLHNSAIPSGRCLETAVEALGSFVTYLCPQRGHHCCDWRYFHTQVQYTLPFYNIIWKAAHYHRSRPYK